MHIRRALALGLALVALAGCNRVKEKLAEKAAEKAAEKVVEKATGTEIDIGSSSGSVTVRDPKTGAVAHTGTSLPDGWPSVAAPIYPGGKIVGSLSTPTGKQVTFTTTASADQVHAFYKAKLPGKEEAALDLGGSKVLTKTDGTTSYAATIGKSQDGVSVQLLVTTQ
ncbi:MAG: hypothetical protein KF894_00150 [Labilithrix sp.]|nr:hypothetical protein [Labilithrix sp.]